MSVLGPYVLTDCAERKTEARTTVGYVTYQQQANCAAVRSCLRLPYRQRRLGERREHVTTPRDSDSNNLPMYVILCQLVGRAGTR
jgi:hypothetical protein